MENFEIGEIVWGKIKGVPWWPGIIVESRPSQKGKLFYISFIGSKSYSTLPSKYLSKYEKDYKNFSNTKKQDLLEAINKADSLIKDQQSKNNFLSGIKKKKKAVIDDEDEKENFEDYSPLEKDEESVLSRKRAPSPTPSRQSSQSHKSTKSKSSRFSTSSLQNKGDVALTKKITRYLMYIAKTVENKEYEVIKTEHSCFVKVLEHYKEVQILNPVEFLKTTNAGKLIRYIYINLPEEETELKNLSFEVYKILEDQLLKQLYKKM